MPSLDTVVTPDQVLELQQPTTGYLCPLSANSYGIEFTKFEIKDYDTGSVVFKISREPLHMELPEPLEPEVEHLIRSVKYKFPAAFLKYKTIRTLVEFVVGNQPANDFRMVERHYFKGKLVRSYDFTFGFCIPNSTNSWEAIYDMPEYSPAEIQDYLSSPGEHSSDSFYFADGRLIMHNKAAYTYAE